MTDQKDLLMTALLCVDPQALGRANRLAFAITMLKQTGNELEVRQAVEQTYGCSRTVAWRTVDMARDVV